MDKLLKYHWFCALAVILFALTFILTVTLPAIAEMKTPTKEEYAKMVAELPKNAKWKFNRDTAVLLVIDMTKAFIGPTACLPVPECLKQMDNFKAIIGACRKVGVPVIYSAHQHQGTKDMGLMKIWPTIADQSCLQSSDPRTQEIYPEIANKPGELVLPKHRYNFFFDTDLETILRNIRGPRVVDTTIIIGDVTNYCCESTARGAFYRDYKVVFPADANCPFRWENHWATCYTIAEGFGRVVLTGDLVKWLMQGKE